MAQTLSPAPRPPNNYGISVVLLENGEDGAGWYLIATAGSESNKVKLTKYNASQIFENAEKQVSGLLHIFEKGNGHMASQLKAQVQAAEQQVQNLERLKTNLSEFE